MEVISVESPLFKHQRLEAELRRLATALPEGARLPAEQELARRHDCNYQTVRRALKALVEDGTIVRLVGKGTFVAKRAKAEIVAGAPAGGVVGVLMWSSGHGITGRIMASLTKAADEVGAGLRSVWIGDFEKDAVMGAAVLAKQGCSALVLPWFPPNQTDELRAFVGGCPLPVHLPMLVPGIEAGFREGWDAGRASMVGGLVDYFRALGSARIAFVGPDAPEDVVLQRLLTGYACALSRVGLESNCHLVKAGDPAMDQAAGRCAALRGELAVIAYDDEHALRFMAAMRRLGLSAPGDFRIVGFNDTEPGAWGDPPLSTVRHDYDQIARRLMRGAMNIVTGGRDERGAPRLQLVVRSSCGGAGSVDDRLRARVPGLELVTD
ncbi:MAG: substrate-binding domain-containing protein [Verrucomicrobiota bacterium]